MPNFQVADRVLALLKAVRRNHCQLEGEQADRCKMMMNFELGLAAPVGQRLVTAKNGPFEIMVFPRE